MPESFQPDWKSPEKLAPVWRALIEVGFIVFLYYSNLLMGEYEASGQGPAVGLAGHIHGLRFKRLMADF